MATEIFDGNFLRILMKFSNMKPKTTRREAIKYMGLGILTTQMPFELPSSTKPFKVAYVLFDGITLLDFVGIYDPLSRIKSKKFMEDFSWDLCGVADSMQDGFGLKVTMDKVKPDLAAYDMVIIPGGFGTRKLQFDDEFINWIKTAKNVTYKVSVCTGSLLLGSAGFLKNKTATTNFNEYKTLENYCDNVVKYRIVDDGNVITAGAVASSLDLGLYLCEKLVGREKTEEIRKSMDYIPSQFEISK